MKYRTPFEPGRRYHWRLTPDTLRVDRIIYAELLAWMRVDGRPMGMLADRLICARHDNLELPAKGCGSFDIMEHPISGGLRAYEVKTASRHNPVDLLPSMMKGKGRKFDAGAHDARRDGLFGYIILDVGALPELRMIGLPMHYILENHYIRRIPRRAIDRLFTDDLFSHP